MHFLFILGALSNEVTRYLQFSWSSQSRERLLVLTSLYLMEFLCVFIALFLNIRQAGSALLCGHVGVFGNSFNLGHTPERGQRPRMSSQPPVTLLGSPGLLMRRFFSASSK